MLPLRNAVVVAPGASDPVVANTARQETQLLGDSLRRDPETDRRKHAYEMADAASEADFNNLLAEGTTKWDEVAEKGGEYFPKSVAKRVGFDNASQLAEASVLEGMSDYAKAIKISVRDDSPWYEPRNTWRTLSNNIAAHYETQGKSYEEINAILGTIRQDAYEKAKQRYATGYAESKHVLPDILKQKIDPKTGKPQQHFLEAMSASPSVVSPNKKTTGPTRMLAAQDIEDYQVELLGYDSQGRSKQEIAEATNKNIAAPAPGATAATTQFDPMGSGYDEGRAAADGLTRDKNGHMGSVTDATPAEAEALANSVGGLPPGTEVSLYLKGRNHETFDKALAAETARGAHVLQGPDGRLYSVKPPVLPQGPTPQSANLIPGPDGQMIQVGPISQPTASLQPVMQPQVSAPAPQQSAARTSPQMIAPSRIEAIAAKHGVPAWRVQQLYNRDTARRYGYADMAVDPTTGQATHYQTKDGKWVAATSSSVRDVVHPRTGKSVGIKVGDKFLSNKELGITQPLTRKQRMEKAADIVSQDNSLVALDKAFKVITDPDSNIVGPVAGTWVGGTWDTLKAIAGDNKDLRGRRELDRIIKTFTLDSAQLLKGPISEKELKFLNDMNIGLEDDEETWKEYLETARDVVMARKIDTMSDGTSASMRELLRDFTRQGLITKDGYARMARNIDTLEKQGL